MSRAIARRELAALKERRERIERLEHGAETLLAHYAGMVPEALDNLTPGERHRIYKMLREGASPRFWGRSNFPVLAIREEIRHGDRAA